MMNSFGFLTVSAGLSIFLMAQSFVLTNTHADVFWVACFITLGDAFASLFQVFENLESAQLDGFWSLTYFLVRAILRAVICVILIYGLKKADFFYFVLLHLVFAIVLDFLLYDKWKDKPSIFGLAISSFFILCWGCLIKFNGDVFYFASFLSLLCGSILVNYCCDAACRLQKKNLWSRVFEYFFSSIGLAICGWLCFSDGTYVDWLSFWPLFPFFLVMSGFCKSFYDLRLGENNVPFIVMWTLIFLFGFYCVSFAFDLWCKSDFFVLFSGGILFFSALSSMKITKPNSFFEAPNFLILSKKKGELLVTNVINFYIYNKHEQKLAIFFILTFAVMFLELFYGISANSLGMMTDSFHMLLDSLSIAIGLVAAFAASLPSDKNKYPFGYGRYRILGGFINAVLLLFIALFVVLESIERFIDPPEIKTGYLIHVSIIGLIVNVIGVAFFHTDHHHHSHGGCTGSTDHNLRGVYLHILADLVGSISVMLSSILIYFTKIQIFDPLFSFLSSVFIFLSALPLLEETGKVLLLSNHPYDKETLSNKALAGIQEIAGVSKIDNFCVWTHSTLPSESIYCAVRLSAQRSADYSCVRRSIKNFLGSFLTAETGSHNIDVLVHIE